MRALLKQARLKKNLLVRELAAEVNIDQALISKFESGKRLPTKAQLMLLANALDINLNSLLVLWLKEKIVYEIIDEPFALEALHAAEQEIKYQNKKVKAVKLPPALKHVLTQIDACKKQLNNLRQYDSFRIAQALELEYTFESNRIEGNTLTLKETDLVINEGLTISGKSMREHLEAINHNEAILYIKQLVEQDTVLNERELLTIHNLVLRGINQQHAGKYRTVQVMIKGSKHIPPSHLVLKDEMDAFFNWYNIYKDRLHPVVLAAELHERLVTIHPFIDGNGRTSRLLMNLTLLKHGYVIANIKGDYESRMAYYSALEQAQVNKNRDAFILLVANYELGALQHYIDILSAK